LPARGKSKLRAEQVLPPGTILQRSYVRKRLRHLSPGQFVEVGLGQGVLTRLLLDLGWSGVGWDLDAEVMRDAATRHASDLRTGRLELHTGDWLTGGADRPVDLVLSSMVLEHLTEEDVSRYFALAASVLRPGGLAVTLVPASPRHWGIEDDIAGHLRRYTRESLRDTVEQAGWEVVHLVGLTYPISNLLLWLSNRQVVRWEAEKTALDVAARTAASGRRTVPWKTTFPSAARFVLNDAVLFPFHLGQQVMSGAADALVLYCEARPIEQVRS
jgi:SAM-dependent methyltransferase